MRKTHLTFVLVLLIAGVAAFTGVQLQAGAADYSLGCGSTGEKCDNNWDCTNISNPTCYCAHVSGEDSVCREDLPLEDIIDIDRPDTDLDG